MEARCGRTSTRRCSDITRCDKATKAETSSTDDANETDDAITKVSRRCRAAGAGPSGASVRARAAAHVTCVRAFARHFDRTARARPAGRGPVVGPRRCRQLKDTVRIVVTAGHVRSARGTGYRLIPAPGPSRKSTSIEDGSCVRLRAAFVIELRANPSAMSTL